PDEQQVTIEVARMLREIFLQQNAYDPVDTYCDMVKQFDIMKAIKYYSDQSNTALKAGVMTAQITGLKAKLDLPQIKYIKDYKPEMEKIMKGMETEFTQLREAA
ncbi:MAG: V-type ATP synthase subunit A, partial [Methanobacteriota archaeon]